MAPSTLDAFQAIGDSSRRKMLMLLSHDSLTINSLADNFEMSRPAASKHIKILYNAGFIAIQDAGRERYCSLKQDGFSGWRNWISFFDRFWATKLKKLKDFLNKKSPSKKKIMTAIKTALTTQQVATRFNELAQQEKWFDIQDELFADNVKSNDPPGSPYFGNAEGKAAVRKKGEDFVKKIEGAHRMYTSEPLVTGNHFTVAREKDITVKGFGRIQINEIMLYEVKDGQIVLEQFFY